MATVAIAQSASFQNASASTGTATLGSVPSATTIVCLVVAAGAAVVTPPSGYTLLPGSPGNPVLQAYYKTGGTQAVSVTLQSSAPLAMYYFELSSAAVSLVSNSAGTSTTTATLTANTPLTWLTTAGDLPLAFFTSAAPATGTTQSGWATLCNLNNGNANVLNGQSGPVATSGGQSYTGTTTWSATNPSGETLLISANQSFYDLTSQGVVEVLGAGTSNAHTSQAVVEVVSQDTANAHTSQETLEVLGQDTANVRSSQIYIELVIPLYTRVSQDVLEIVGQGAGRTHTSQMYLEVLFSSQGQRRRTVDEEWFTT